MLKQILSLLPKSAIDREALTHSSLNIKPRLFLKVTLGLKRLTSFFIIVLMLLVLTPHIAFAQDQKIQFNLPHPSLISTYFSNFHPGIDLAADLGTPIHPTSAGIVEEVIYEQFGLGTHVVLSHPNDYKSVYGHMSRVFVKVGQTIDNTSILGEVGLTGHTSGAHTHLEITKDGNYVDPTSLLPKILPLDNSQLVYPTIKTELTKTLKPDFN